MSMDVSQEAGRVNEAHRQIGKWGLDSTLKGMMAVAATFLVVGGGLRIVSAFSQLPVKDFIASHVWVAIAVPAAAGLSLGALVAVRARSNHIHRHKELFHQEVVRQVRDVGFDPLQNLLGNTVLNPAIEVFLSNWALPGISSDSGLSRTTIGACVLGKLRAGGGHLLR